MVKSSGDQTGPGIPAKAPKEGTPEKNEGRNSPDKKDR